MLVIVYYLEESKRGGALNCPILNDILVRQVFKALN